MHFIVFVFIGCVFLGLPVAETRPAVTSSENLDPNEALILELFLTTVETLVDHVVRSRDLNKLRKVESTVLPLWDEWEDKEEAENTATEHVEAFSTERNNEAERGTEDANLKTKRKRRQIPQFGGLDPFSLQQQFGGLGQQQFNGLGQQQFGGLGQQLLNGLGQQQLGGLGQQLLNGLGQQQLGGLGQQQLGGLDPLTSLLGGAANLGGLGGQQFGSGLLGSQQSGGLGLLNSLGLFGGSGTGSGGSSDLVGNVAFMRALQFGDNAMFPYLEAAVTGHTHRDPNRCRRDSKCPSTTDALIQGLNDTPGGLQGAISNLGGIITNATGGGATPGSPAAGGVNNPGAGTGAGTGTGGINDLFGLGPSGGFPGFPGAGGTGGGGGGQQPLPANPPQSGFFDPLTGSFTPAGGGGSGGSNFQPGGGVAQQPLPSNPPQSGFFDPLTGSFTPAGSGTVDNSFQQQPGGGFGGPSFQPGGGGGFGGPTFQPGGGGAFAPPIVEAIDEKYNNTEEEESLEFIICVPKSSPRKRLPSVLVLENCNIDEAGSEQDILEKCGQVRELDLARNLLSSWDEGYTQHEKRQFTIARLPKITKLNGGLISAKEKEESERAFIRYYDSKPDRPKPARYGELLETHGPLFPLVELDLKPKTEVLVLIRWKELQVQRRITVYQTVGELKAKLREVAGLPLSRMRLFYVDQGMKGGFGPEEMKYPNKQLYSYNINDGDEFIVDAKS
nr:EOG090X05JJ [Lepidurus arcticus]